MDICIATLRNSEDKILKFRILSVERKQISDLLYTDIIKHNSFSNIKIQDSKIVCTQGDIESYPKIYGANIKNNVPIVLSTSEDETTIANSEGKVVKLATNSLIQKTTAFANAYLYGGWLLISDDEVEVSKEKLVIESGRGNTETKVQNKTQLSPLEQVMQADALNMDLKSFNMMDHYKKFNVSDSILKSPMVVFTSSRHEDKPTVNNPSAYSFDIIKAEDRVELRMYIGNGYTGLVEIPDGVTHICAKAFEQAEATELTMPESVRFIGDGCFRESKFRKIRLSNNVTAIPFCCFFGASIEEINLNNITSIDNMAFCKCNINEVKIDAPLIQVGYEAFKDCSSLSLFEHAGTIKKIRHHAFSGCMNLTTFDFSSVTTIEQYAFEKTGLKSAKLNGEINYLQTGTFTGDIEEIELLDGMYKISSSAVSNIHNAPITWTVPNSVTNIEKGAFTKQDTVVCYRKSVAASSALIAEANVVYLDELDTNSIPNVLKVAALIDVAVSDILNNALKSIVNSDNINETYDIDEEKAVKADIPDDILKIIGGEFRYGAYATAEDIEAETMKFRCIVEHLYKVAMFDITPFSKAVVALQNTFNVVKDEGKLEVLYKDNISSVYRIVYADNKFMSVNSSFIVAKTKDTLRYICMDNKYTDIMCENSEVQDQHELLKILTPGDTIGLNNVVSGVKYPDIAYESPKQIQTSKNGFKQNIKIKMNMYQALRYSAVTVRIDNNNIVLLLPGNKKIIKCASLGKTVWQNEKEDTYKSLQCTIESIEDIGSDTVFDYKSTYKPGNHGLLLKRFREMRQDQYSSYIDNYSHIYKADISMYKHAGNYAYIHNMKNISDVNMEFMLILFKTQLFEERPESWLEGSIGKTIVADVQHEFNLADGSTLYQYRTVKKTALRNKLMSGGDRKLYIFELIDDNGVREGVYISLYDINTLVDMCININKQTVNKNGKTVDKRIFTDGSKFDTVDGDDVIEVAGLCKDSVISIQRIESRFILGVYKPNGLYYIGFRITFGKTFKFIPLIQIGELDVALEFIEDTNKYGVNNDSMKYLYKGGLGALGDYFGANVGMGYGRTSNVRYSPECYSGLLRAKQLCINGVSNIEMYNEIRLPEILKRCLGFTSNIDSLYELPDLSKIKTQELVDSIDDIDLSDIIDDSLDEDIDEEDIIDDTDYEDDEEIELTSEEDEEILNRINLINMLDQ